MHARRLSPPMEMTRPRLSLGPLTYYWPREEVLRFYEEALSWPVDIVYLGETVCSRRHELRLPDWIRLAERFEAAGKEAVLSTYELIETEADLRTMRTVAGNERFLVEANDMGAVHILAGQGRPFVAGPFLNVYNAQTLEILVEAGAKRWSPAIELASSAVADIVRAVPHLETEIFAYGRLPLAISARCFTARYHNVTKDHCDYRCLHDPEGLAVGTQDGQPFLVMNGVQTQSGGIHSLLGHFEECVSLGIQVFRLSPRRGMASVVDAFARAARGEPHVALPAGHESPIDGYWRGRSGIEAALEGV